MSIELVFGDSLAAVELIDAAPNLGIDGFLVLRKPAVLFLLSFQQAEQHFLHTGGAGCLELLLDSGFQSGIQTLLVSLDRADVVIDGMTVGRGWRDTTSN